MLHACRNHGEAQQHCKHVALSIPASAHAFTKLPGGPSCTCQGCLPVAEAAHSFLNADSAPTLAGSLSLHCNTFTCLAAMTAVCLRPTRHVHSCRGSKALVHWWYAPDSYDAFINADTAPEEPEPDRRVRGTPFLPLTSLHMQHAAGRHLFWALPPCCLLPCDKLRLCTSTACASTP